MPAAPDLAALFALPPEEAIAFFRSKGYAISWNWWDTWREAHDRAFTVAKATRLDILQDIRAAVDEALAAGQTERWFKQTLGPVLQRKGWWGRKLVVDPDGAVQVIQEGSPRRLETIFRTNLQTSYAAGRWKAFEANAAARPYVEYVAVMDGRTRPAHAALNGRVFRIDDPALEVIAPPNGWNCRCRLRALSGADLRARGLKAETDARIVSVPVPGRTLVDARTGEVDPQKLVRRGVSVPGPLGERVTLLTDLGWDYNPGGTWQKPFAPPPLDTLPRSFPAGMALPDLPAPQVVPASRLLAPGLPPEDYARAFLREFGADVGKPVVFRDVAQGALVIDEALFQDAAGNWKSRKDGRGPFMALLADAVRAPDEIWLHWEASRDRPGTWLLKRRYLKTFELVAAAGADVQYGLTVFEFGADGWTGSTAMMAKPDRTPQARRDYIARQRGGFLLYRRK
jgi:SPP1 gp7 family putative phage head morphogenesis protein